MIKTIEYNGGVVRMIDQTKLPLEEIYVDCRTIEDVGLAIKRMIIRGAPAIGVAAAMGVSLGAESIQAEDFESFYSQLEEMSGELALARPTAVNLAWAIERMKKNARENRHLGIRELKEKLKREALNICKEDVAANRAMGGHGQTLINDGDTILTH
ncbi:MAG: S-methyl-5-thioribose-1-phosphate isomerase, partial [Nitrospinales bacterium]